LAVDVRDQVTGMSLRVIFWTISGRPTLALGE
jgi:hypothetical protein